MNEQHTTGRWLRALHSRPTADIQALSERLCRQGDWRIQPKTLTQAGLGMLQLRDSAHLDNYNLGEIPLASAWLVIELPSGETFEGAAQVMDDKPEIAEALAVCDAVLRHQLPGVEEVEAELARGFTALAQQARERRAMLARTRVDFSLLDSGDDDE